MESAASVYRATIKGEKTMDYAQSLNSEHRNVCESDIGASPRTSPVIQAALLKHQSDFRSYLMRRLGNRSTVEDVLQSFCLRVITSKTELRDSKSVTAWLYTVLRSALVDHFRSEKARRQREAGYAEEQIALAEDCGEPEPEENNCRCYRRVMPTLRSDYAELLERVDLAGESRVTVAESLNISQTNLRVRLHRARRSLRKGLDSYCGACCKTGFRNCTCDHS